MDPIALQQISVSLGIGLLLGLQRERTERSIAGIRTFPLISLFGTVCAMIAANTSSWIIAAGLIALAALVISANRWKVRRQSENDAGMTTEIATLSVYVLGVLVVVGQLEIPVVLAGAMALLLHFKAPLHQFARSIGERDMQAIIQFSVISLIILPVLPNEGYGPYGVLNPFRIWLMVVLVSGIGLAGYVVYKIFSSRAGSLLGGILGGLISSTATTVTFARRTKHDPKVAPLAAFVIMIASCVSLARVLFIIGVVAAGSFTHLAPPLAVMLAICCMIASFQYLRCRRDSSEMPEQKNPTEFKPAIIFAILYALVLMGVAFAKDRYGDSGLYAVAGLSGLTDMDAITLSTAQMAAQEQVGTITAWRAILIAAMANFIFKFGIVAVLGSRALVLWVAALFSLCFVTGSLILWLWPVTGQT